MKARIALAAAFACLATGAGADAPTRAAYAQGFWDGFATAGQVVAASGRSGRPAFGISDADPSAPVWIIPIAGVDGNAGTRFLLPPVYTLTAGTAAVYFKGPWHWTEPAATALFPADGFDRDRLDRSTTLAEAPSVPESVLARIRHMRAMGLNEGIVLVGVTPTQ